MKSLTAAVLALPLAALAAGPTTPDAGTLLQQLKPVAPPEPASTQPPVLKPPAKAAQTARPSAPFLVRAIRISGNTLFDTATLHTLVADAEGQPLTLAQLEAVAERITTYYQTHGQPLARAIVPAQTVREGTLTIEVVEARYGQVSLSNQSRVRSGLLQNMLSPLRSGQFVEQDALDRVLLLASDLPGTRMEATLKPGDAVGTSDLAVSAATAAATAGVASLDNFGNRYTGRARAGASVNVFNLLGYGDTLGVSALTSGAGLHYLRGSYESLVNGQGTRLGAAYANVYYRLGKSLSDLDAHGTADVGSLWASHPLLRSRDRNVYGRLGYDHKQLRDHIDKTALQTDRQLDNWTLSLNGDWRDALLGGALNGWNVSWTTAQVDFRNAAAQEADQATARTAGGFSKWNASFSRVQGLTPNHSVYLMAAVQAASGNLDSSEKLSAGGPYSVRAYDTGALSGDAGQVLTLEYRYDFAPAALGQWQAQVFFDTARVTVNQDPWGSGRNSATLSGAGVGVSWQNADQWRARAYVATRVGAHPALLAHSAATRGWVEVSKGF